MDAPVFENLDLACAKAAQEIAEHPSKELEKLVTDALAVLEERGLYALFLYLLADAKAARGGKDLAERIGTFLRGTPRQAPLLPGNDEMPQAVRRMGEDLDKLLLAYDLVRQTLVYARYHARIESSKGARR